MTPSEQITQASGSNLAMSFLALPREKRRDMNVFYAFCRLVDDLADEPGPTFEMRRTQLGIWREAVFGAVKDEHPVAAELRHVLERYGIDRKLLVEIIAGMEMDLQGLRYETLDDLRLYCYRVAGAVGLVSIEIFGYRHASARDHARALGEALQLTNILRDVGDDFRNGRRIYLPLDLLRNNAVSEDDLEAGRENAAFFHVMQSVADVAREDYAKAEAFLHPEDRRSLRPGLIMGDIYRGVLAKMERNKFRVFSTQHRLNKLEKSLHIVRRLIFP